MSQKRVRIILTPDVVEQERGYFKRIDKDGNGNLDEEELMRFFSDEKRAYLKPFTKLIVKVFGENGKVSWEQFLNFWKAYAADPDAGNHIGKVLFNFIDKDHSGIVDYDEAKGVMDLIDTEWESNGEMTGMNFEQFKAHFLGNGCIWNH